jgi:hypothetical protein
VKLSRRTPAFSRAATISDDRRESRGIDRQSPVNLSLASAGNGRVEQGEKPLAKT